jgi:hypothetical protein
MSGWIKIHRSITNHWLYSEKRVYSKLEAWYDMLIAVNYSDTKTIIKGKLYEVKRGQSILSLESWGKRWNWDKSKVRRFFNLLENDSMIELKCDNTTTHLTVCKYESYQGERNTDETPVKRKRNTRETNIRNKENKEENIYRDFEHLSISVDEFNKLCIDYTKQQIDEILDQIENNANNKKYTSLYLTAKNWLSRNKPTQSEGISPEELKAIKLGFLKPNK